MRIHCETNHGLKDKYKCSLCAFGGQEERLVQQHMHGEHQNVSHVVITIYSVIDRWCFVGAISTRRRCNSLFLRSQMIEDTAARQPTTAAAAASYENDAKALSKDDKSTAEQASPVAVSPREDDATAYVTPLVLPYRNDFFRCGRCAFRTKLEEEMRGHLNEEIEYVR